MHHFESYFAAGSAIQSVQLKKRRLDRIGQSISAPVAGDLGEAAAHEVCLLL